MNALHSSRLKNTVLRLESFEFLTAIPASLIATATQVFGLFFDHDETLKSSALTRNVLTIFITSFLLLNVLVLRNPFMNFFPIITIS